MSNIILPESFFEEQARKRKSPDDFRGYVGEFYDVNECFGGRCSYTAKVLPELTGKKWGKLPLSLVGGLKPSRIRVTKGEISCDCQQDRVTVYVDHDDIIKYIEMELSIGSDNMCERDVRKELGL